ncbi:uncharacterized protein Z518_03002 [Rhinocladiella mackenziei CBS 650.93]|uniref:RWD domain-containing protein n=1 Tax=Rhinocladiella mackenziei CBS 650.93 TaxID=1442369 RepID=A0A0D2IY71_9EURO|nr:uncharacterized protein Z518_03002 [Rhinocladiella mackenziei CBS 650.93]KIX08346.1 hypothetical protein Z518_03002 [Rhinocladiella mackenziei CBS 650.93]
MLVVHNQTLTEEITVLNAIYGDGSVQATFSDNHHSTISLQLPGLNYAFLLRVLDTYPQSQPTVIGVDDLVASLKPVVQQNVVFFGACVAAVHHSGEVCLFDAIQEFNPILEIQRKYAQSNGDQEKHQELMGERSLMVRELAIRARERATWRPGVGEDSLFAVVDCAACMEPFFRVEMANLVCRHAFCRECLHG